MRLAFLGLSMFLVVSPAAGQDRAGPATTERTFLEKHGASWRICRDPVTGNPGFVYGSRVPLATSSATAEQFERAALALVDENLELFGFGVEDLVPRGVHRLKLAKHGSSDKVSVAFAQVHDGIPVLNGAVSVLFDEHSGDLLAVRTSAVPYPERAARYPEITMADALVAAAPEFEKTMGVPFSVVRDMQMAIVGPSTYFGREAFAGNQDATLAYVLDLGAPGMLDADGQEAEARAIVSAGSDARVLKIASNVSAASGTVTGKVKSVNADPASTPFGPNIDPADLVLEPLPRMEVKLGDLGQDGVVATTDSNGFYDTGSSQPETLYFELKGAGFDVDEMQSGLDTFVRLIEVSGAGNDVLFDPGSDEFEIAEIAAWYWANHFRSWVYSVDPSDTTLDPGDDEVPLIIEVNTVQPLNTCLPGGYHRPPVNKVVLKASSNACHNAAYGAILLHELGHWAIRRYLSPTVGELDNGFDEGLGFAWYYIISGDPCSYNPKKQGPLCGYSAESTRKKCPRDGSNICNGSYFHDQGEPLAAALWRVRENLNDPDLFNALFLAWHRPLMDGNIVSDIEVHWLVLDDHDGDLSNGPPGQDPTPHYAAITAGFRDTRWPHLGPRFLEVTAPDQDSELPDGAGISVWATIQAIVGTLDLTGANAPALHYARDGEATLTSLAMTATGHPGQFTASIPGATSPDSVQFYVTATDTLGNRRSWPDRMAYPRSGPDQGVDAQGRPFGPHLTRVVHLGKRQSAAYEHDFEGPGAEGWTVSGNGADQWERSGPPSAVNPKGVETLDPAWFGPGGGTGELPAWTSTIWGTDLASKGTLPDPDDIETEYDPWSIQTLESPTFDLATPSGEGWHLRYRRWLTVEDRASDQAEILVRLGTADPVPLFQNSVGRDHLDPGWIDHDLDLSIYDGETISLLFHLTADGAGELGGWNLDDLEIYAVDPDPGLGNWIGYGDRFEGTAGPPPSLTGSGDPIATTGSVVYVHVTGSSEIGGQGFVLFAGAQQASVPLGGGGQRYFDSVISWTTGTLDAGGDATIPISLEGVPAGDIFMQVFVYPDGETPPDPPPLPQGTLYSLTNGLWMHVVAGP